MTTTVRVTEQTVGLLATLKEEMHANSFDEVIKKLIEFKKKKISLFGADPKLKRWDRNEDRMGFHDE